MCRDLVLDNSHSNKRTMIPQHEFIFDDRNGDKFFFELYMIPYWSWAIVVAHPMVICLLQEN